MFSRWQRRNPGPRASTLATTAVTDAALKTPVTRAVARIVLCACCAAQLTPTVEDHGRGCCEGCADLVTVHYHQPGMSCPPCPHDEQRNPGQIDVGPAGTPGAAVAAQEWVEVLPVHEQETRRALLTDTYAGYGPEAGVAVAAPGRLPSLDEQRRMLLGFRIGGYAYTGTEPAAGADPRRPVWHLTFVGDTRPPGTLEMVARVRLTRHTRQLRYLGLARAGTFQRDH